MGISYKDAGVDIEKGAEFVSDILDEAKKTHNSRVLNTIGSFASLYDISGFKNPVLVSGTDGVGTKLLLAITYNQFEGIGQDCVAMCLNDILCHGAKPLYFLDYLACANLDKAYANTIIKSIARACKMCDCALVGGETAEMPGMYKKGDFDIAGFAVGLVDKEYIIDGSHIQEGDVLIACASNGLHSNGYSLVRMLYKEIYGSTHNQQIVDLLLQPTRLYVKTILPLLAKYNSASLQNIRGLAHITGGGIIENLPRIIPQGLQAVVQRNNIPPQEIFQWIRETDKVEEYELWSTFNMGIGMVLVVSPHESENVLFSLKEKGEQAFICGHIANDIPETATQYINAQKDIRGAQICLI